MYVDLDVGQNGITVPGVVAATPVDHPIAIDDTAAPFYTAPPLAYYYGHTSPVNAPELYQKLVERLAAAVDVRATKQPESTHIADTSPPSCLPRARLSKPPMSDSHPIGWSCAVMMMASHPLSASRVRCPPALLRSE
jgi:hypothetical protein